MHKTKFIFTITAVILVVALFNLPKIVVENDREELSATENADQSEGASGQESEDPKQNHASKIPNNILDQIVNLRDLLKNSGDNEKSTIFADSLANLFGEYQRYDSAARYAEISASKQPDLLHWELAAERYYKAFSFAVDKEKQKYLAEKANSFFVKVLEKKPERLDLEAKSAMTLMATESPMVGVLKLRGILEKDPENQTALFNLGTLSMQSGQYDKAVERFQSILNLDPKHSQALFYLGISYMNLGDNEKARSQFLKVKELDDDPAVQATVDGYLEDI